jgi:hypothetical protein
MNETSEEMDDQSFIWWLAGKAALRTSDFYSNYKNLLNIKSGLLSIAAQEVAIFNNVASITNGDVFTNFQKAYLVAIQEHWKDATPEERRKIYEEYNESELPTSEEYYITDEAVPEMKKIFALPRYSNITFTEGIAGSGKTSAVFKMTYEYLKKYNKDLLKNVLVIHGSDSNGSHTNGDKLNKLFGDKGTVMSKEEAIKTYFEGYADGVITDS